ncbi:MAG TPA: MFS transporter [Chthoniobacterales bacterium]
MTLWRDPTARLVLTANFFLIVGAGITFMAVPWLLIHQPQGEVTYGGVNAAVTLLIFALLPAFGKLVDRHSRKRIVLGYYLFCFLLNSAVITSMLLSRRVDVWHLLTVYCLGSLGHSLYYPAQFALNQEIFSPDQYESLSGTIEVLWQAGAMVAGAAGAFAITFVPFWGILCFDTGCYVLGFLLILRVPYRPRRLVTAEKESAWKLLAEGCGYLRERPRLSVVIFGSFLPFLGLMVANYLSPIFVSGTLRAGPEAYGYGEVAYAVGAVAAGLTVPKLNARYGLVGTLLLTIGVFTVASALVPLFPVLAIFVVAFAFQGWGNAGSRVARSILVLQTVPNELVGRVNLFYGAGERLLRSVCLVAATWQVAVSGPRTSYWMIAGIAFSAWILVLVCRRTRLRPVPPRGTCRRIGVSE